ncbi:MAG: outer membrane protein assembly factor BamB [Pseudomonadales bacterium]
MKPYPLNTFLLLLLLLSIGGCKSNGDDEPEEIKPTSLKSFKEEVEVEVLWTRKLGKGPEDRAVKIRPAVVGGRVFAASADGTVAAMQASSGNLIWEVQIKDFYDKEELASAFGKDLDVITGGVGAGGDLVVVGTASGEVVALNLSDGSLAWRIPASSEVLAAPQVDRELVVVQTIDGKVAAYDATTGTRNWLYTTTTPALSLRGTATPVLAGEYIIVGFANGRLAMLDRSKGLAGFDERIAIAEGSSDLERLVDIDGNIAIAPDGKLYVASFQGRLVGIDIAAGRLMWSEDSSSVVGVGLGFGNVYLSHADSRVTAYDATNGVTIWDVEALLHRDITAPIAIGSYVALTDYQGYVHLLAQADGRFVGRRKIDGDGIKSGLVVDSGRIYALGDGAKLTALEIR